MIEGPCLTNGIDPILYDVLFADRKLPARDVQPVKLSTMLVIARTDKRIRVTRVY